MKKYVNKLISIKILKRKEPIYGIVIDYNPNWTLMIYNPVDYILDGFILLKNEVVKGFRVGKDEKLKDKVIKLKGYEITKQDAIMIGSIDETLQYLMEIFDILQFELEAENIIYIGKINSIDDDFITIRSVSPVGKWSKIIKLRRNKIRIIQFDNDYINSLKLLLVSGKGIKSGSL